ncbi:hypothetical protein BDR03DRAFT_953786 [Suillus americanus]|nr:hypothetical protein BDR03DRAFT_953786 [Suillus americanus]
MNSTRHVHFSLTQPSLSVTAYSHGILTNITPPLAHQNLPIPNPHLRLALLISLLRWSIRPSQLHGHCVCLFVGCGGVLGCEGSGCEIDGVLNHKTAGGNCTHPTYMVNPGYHLRVNNTTSASIDKRPSTRTSDKCNKTQVILTAQSTRDISLAKRHSSVAAK